MRLAVVGHGWIAEKMVRCLHGHDIKRLSHHDALDYVNAEGIARAPIHWVVNCAGVTGYPNVDDCEWRKSDTIWGNTLFPILLGQACADHSWAEGTRFAHFSSGCIFSGGPYSEKSVPNFDGSLYSASKLISDAYLKSMAMVLRIRMPFDGSDHPKNLLVKLRDYAEKAQVLDGYNSLSSIDEMCAIAAVLIEEGASNGVYHLVNKDAIWTHEIIDMMGIKAEYWDKADFSRNVIAPRSECQLTTALPTNAVRVALAAAIEKMKVAA